MDKVKIGEWLWKGFTILLSLIVVPCFIWVWEAEGRLAGLEYQMADAPYCISDPFTLIVEELTLDPLLEITSPDAPCANETADYSLSGIHPDATIHWTIDLPQHGSVIAEPVLLGIAHVGDFAPLNALIFQGQVLENRGLLHLERALVRGMKTPHSRVWNFQHSLHGHFRAKFSLTTPVAPKYPNLVALLQQPSRLPPVRGLPPKPEWVRLLQSDYLLPLFPGPLQRGLAALLLQELQRLGPGYLRVNRVRRLPKGRSFHSFNSKTGPQTGSPVRPLALPP